MAKLDPRLAAGALAAALAVATPFIAGWEGKRNSPHWDRIGKVWDVCYGETRVELRPYTDAECLELLNTATEGFALAVAARNPELRKHPNQWAAATSLAYNVGIANYRRSTVAKQFSAGRWGAACDAFRAWRFAKGKEIRGLKNRREAERALCLKGLPG